MSERKPTPEHLTSTPEFSANQKFSVRDATTFLRRHLGTYSDSSLRQFFDNVDPATLTEKQQKFLESYKENPKNGIPFALLELIIERTLPQAPEGFAGLNELATQARSSPRDVRRCLQAFLRINGFPENASDSVQAWKAGGDALRELFVHARAQGNGSQSIFFSPEGQRLFIEFLREHLREGASLLSVNFPLLQKSPVHPHLLLADKHLAVASNKPLNKVLKKSFLCARKQLTPMIF